MRFFTRFAKIFLICLLPVLAYTLVAAWYEADAIGYLDGNGVQKIAGFFSYWLFWGILYSGSFFLIITFVLALALTLAITIYEFVKCKITP